MAQTFPVNSRYDINDITPGNGLCVAYIYVNAPFVFPFCTLRAAVEEANSNPGNDIITLGYGNYTLDIAGSGEDNAATGDLDVTDSLEIIGVGPDHTFIDASALDRVFDILGKQTQVTLSQLTIMNGNLPAGLYSTEKGGAGIRNQGMLSLDTVVITGNIVNGTDNGDSGGGIQNNGTCLLTNSSISENQAAQGGGIMNSSAASLRITASTIMTNRSLRGAGLMNEGSAILTNSTFAANNCQGSSSAGGALFNRDQMHLIHCTVADNSAMAGGGLHGNGGNITITNTLLANNGGGGNCSPSTTILSEGHNLSSDNSCELTVRDLININPRLLPLRKNGGATMTFALSPVSPAIDSGSPLANITNDQRGEDRPQRKAPDIGAFELGPISVVPLIVPLLL